jgi:flagellar biosynthetic protein FliQ
MQETDVAGLLRESMIVALKLGGPPLLAALAVGLLVSLFQAVTQINEQTLGYVPKVIAICATLIVTGPFMLTTLRDFVNLLFDRLIAVGMS